MNLKNKLRNLETKFSTTQIILLGFLFVILFGTFVLMLPFCSADGEATNFVDALFTATTSVCVTGLVTVPTYSYWSVFGQCVILFLIQFGGLGFMTCFTMVLLALKKRVTLKERMVIQDSLNESGLAGLVKLVKKIIKGTVIVEGAGAILFSFRFCPEFGFAEGLFKSVFNSVSAFCNAGMDILGEESLVPYVGSPLINITTMMLIIAGGIGFTVWWDLIRAGKKMYKEKEPKKYIWRNLTLHSKLVLSITAVLLFGGGILFFIFEYSNPETLGMLSFPQKAAAAFFQSVTTRTAGFMTIPQDDFTLASQFLSIILMFIGGSPAGTAGGIKTVTFGVIILSVISVVKGKERTEVFKRTLPPDTVRKALAIMSISLSVLVMGTMLLSITEGSSSFMELLYEVTSAAATVGLSQGITADLTVISKLLIILLMYMGRIGPITMAIAFGTKRRITNNSIKLPDENVMVG